VKEVHVFIASGWRKIVVDWSGCALAGNMRIKVEVPYEGGSCFVASRWRKMLNMASLSGPKLQYLCRM
jgi:hypothetical protein